MSDETTIPKARLDAEIAKRREAESKLAEARSALATAEKERDGFKAQAGVAETLTTEVQRLKNELSTKGEQSEAHIAMLEAGVKDSGVRDYMRYQYEQHRAAEGDKAKAWDAWWKATLEKPPTVLSAALTPDKAQTPADDKKGADGGPAAPQPPNQTTTTSEQKGITPSPTPPSPWSPGTVAGMSREEFSAQKAELLKGLDLTSLM